MTNLGVTWTWHTGDLNTTTSYTFEAGFGALELRWLVRPFGFTTTNLQDSEFGVYGSGWNVNATIRKDVPKNAELACAFVLDWNREAHRGYLVAQVVLNGEAWGEVEVQLPGRIGDGSGFGRPVLPHSIAGVLLDPGFSGLGTLGTATAMSPTGWASFGSGSSRGLLTPMGGNPARLWNGGELVLRPDVASGNAAMYARGAPGEPWVLVRTVTATDAGTTVVRAGGAAPYLPHIAAEYRLGASTAKRDIVTIGGTRGIYDLAGTMDTSTLQATPRSDRYVPTGILWDRHSGFWWWSAYCRDDLVVNTSQLVTGDATVAAAAVRDASDADMTPHPWVRRRFDALLEVGACVGDYIRTWRSSPDWLTWTLDRDDELGPEARLEAVNHAVGRSGVEAIIGYHAGDGVFYLFHRSDDTAWLGPVSIDGSAYPAAPYVMETPDGRWEAGWFDGTVWTMFRADHPAGPWAEVTP